LLTKSDVFRKQTKWDDVVENRREASQQKAKEGNFMGHPDRLEGGNRLKRSMFPRISKGLLNKYSDLKELKIKMSLGSTPGMPAQ
jgi:hypothetical protein